MPIPFLAAAVGSVLTARNGYIVAGLFVTFKEEILGAVYQVLEGDGIAGWVTDKVNAKIAAAGLDLHFRNVFEVEQVKEDADTFVAGRINAKAGTNFTSLRTLDREQVLTEVSKVLAARVNTATGAHLAQLWPVERLREELGTELARQFDDGVDLSPGGLFPQSQLLMLQAKVGRKLGVLQDSPVNVPGQTRWGPPRDAAHALQRAKARARAAKFRRHHRQVWIPT